MSYKLLYQRPYDDHEDPFMYVETDMYGNIIEEPEDNGLEHRVTFEKFNISYLLKGDEKDKCYYNADSKFSLYVTESRLIFKLKSLKSETTFNGSLIDMGIEAIFDKVEGQQNIGQLRYEWLIGVMYFEKKKWSDRDMLRFIYYDRNNTRYQITISFEYEMDVRFIANEILHMACRYKETTRNEKSEELIATIEKYKTEEIPPADDPLSSFSAVYFPTAKAACCGRDDRPVLKKAE